jgi:hypothetical protein
MASKPDFRFLENDVETQKRIAREALDEAKKLDAELSRSDLTGPARTALEEAKRALIRLARETANNANSTSSSAIFTMSRFLQSDT